MKALSASTKTADPFRAGLSLAASLKPVQPELVIVFTAINYSGSQELLEGIYEGLGNEDLVLIGNTGDGFYETDQVSDLGAAALGLNSQGQVTWQLYYETEVKANPTHTAKRLTDRIKRDTASPAFIFLVSDFDTDASQIEKVLADEVDCPVVGGFAADDNQMQQSFVYCQREVITDAVAALVVSGDVQFEIGLSNSLIPIGNTGVIKKAQGANIYQIDDMNAMRFIEREMGKSVLQSDSGITTLMVTDQAEEDIKRLRSIVPKFSDSDQSLGLYGGIEEGSKVQVCITDGDELIEEVHEIVQRYRQMDRTPVAAIIVSCVGRKWVLGEKVESEVEGLRTCFRGMPFIGFPSFGEFAPIKTETGYSRNLFHNMSSVLLLIYS